MLVALYLIHLVLDAATNMRTCHKSEFLHHQVADSSEDDNGFNIIDNQATLSIKLHAYSVEELAILIVHNFLLIIDSQEVSNYLVLSLQESKGYISVPLQQVLGIPVYDIVGILNVRFGQIISIYNKKTFQHQALLLSQHCSELSENSQTWCNVYCFTEARINVAKFQRILLFKNAQDLRLLHFYVTGALVNCFCLDEKIVSCHCDNLHTPLYIVITMVSSPTVLHLKRSLGHKVNIFIHIWEVSSIITLSGSSKYMTLPIYVDESLHLIVSKGAGFVLDDCWEVTQHGVVKRMNLCCNLKHHKNTSLMKIENLGNSTIFLMLENLGLGIDHLRIETIDYSGVMNRACFDKTNSCRRLISYNSQGHIRLIDQEDAPPKDAQVKQSILVCAENNIVILCDPEELDSSYKLDTIKDVKLKENNFIALIASLTTVFMLLCALHLLWNKYRNSGLSENTYNEPEDISESHYIDETVHIHHKKDSNRSDKEQSHIIENVYSDDDCSEYEFSNE